MTMMSSMRELRALLDDIADIDWRHPAWWGKFHVQLIRP